MDLGQTKHCRRCNASLYWNAKAKTYVKPELPDLYDEATDTFIEQGVPSPLCIKSFNGTRMCEP